MAQPLPKDYHHQPKDRSKLMERTIKAIPSPLIKTSLIPSGHRLVVFRDTVPEKLDSGLYIPMNERDRNEAGCNSGRVLAVGPDAWPDSETPWAKVGDRVIFGKYAGLNVDDEQAGERLLMLNDDDVVGVIKDA